MTPDVLVTVEGGVANVTIKTPGVVVEVRDYDLVAVTPADELYTDEDGGTCYRYLVDDDG